MENNNLYKKLKKYNLDDAINIEGEDRQFLALEKLWKTSPQPSTPGHYLLSFQDNSPCPLEEREYNEKVSIYLFLIMVNALICYQLSWKWEDYWEEFGTSPLAPLLLKGEGNIEFSEIYSFFEKFIRESKNNRRFIETKLKRVKKIESFYEEFISKPEFYYKNMDKLALDLSKIMDQKKEAKTIVFAVKMFSYWARNVFWYSEYFPENIMIPIDSRLENLYKKYNNPSQPSFNTKGGSNKEIKEFYINLSEKLKIPLLHLDAILWVNYEKLME